jgi:hypothetical protein
MDLDERRKDEPQCCQKADTCKENKYNEEAAHPAEERGTAHMTPAFWRPFFILRPPRRALTTGKVWGMIHIDSYPVVE